MEIDREWLKKGIEEDLKQIALDDEALASNDDAKIKARLIEALEWERTSPYGSSSGDRLLEMANDLAKERFGKSFDEMNKELQ
jgi:hypothetical protein